MVLRPVLKPRPVLRTASLNQPLARTSTPRRLICRIIKKEMRKTLPGAVPRGGGTGGEEQSPQ